MNNSKSSGPGAPTIDQSDCSLYIGLGRDLATREHVHSHDGKLALGGIGKILTDSLWSCVFQSKVNVYINKQKQERDDVCRVSPFTLVTGNA